MSKPICLYFCYKTAPPNLTSGPACIVSQLGQNVKFREICFIVTVASRL